MTTKRLYRKRNDRVIAGVCSGVADYLNTDPVLIRILWLLLVFGLGTGLLAYIICWILMPEEPWS